MALTFLPVYKLAFIPALIAILFGVLSFLKIKKEDTPKILVYSIFIISALALIIIVYRYALVKPEVGNIENFEQREKDSEKEAIEELENIEIIE